MFPSRAESKPCEEEDCCAKVQPGLSSAVFTSCRRVTGDRRLFEELGHGFLSGTI